MPDPRTAIPCPYKQLPDTAYWRKSISNTLPEAVDPVINPRFTISQSDKVATAGSCFAQHIARRLRASGGNYFVTEPGHSVLGEDLLAQYNYGTFSARFGNIYTARQLLQMLERAYGERVALDDIWPEPKGGFTDPFRPFIQPGGFPTEAEYRADRDQHYAAIRRMVEEADIFVFTLGLTEAWENSHDGSIYAICPGCGAGTHYEGESNFHNFTVFEVIADLEKALAFMRQRNPDLRVLLTVSPVPLIASFSGQHVLNATSYSKSVLRVAAEHIRASHNFVDYFPSYEIITSGFSRGTYFGPDLREIEEIGVSHAMRCFFRNYCPDLWVAESGIPASTASAGGVLAERANSTLTVAPPLENRGSELARIVCDEERLEQL